MYSSDGEELGKVEHVLGAELDIFDGIVLDTSVLPGGHRFVDAPEVAEIYERGVVLRSTRRRHACPSRAPTRARSTSTRRFPAARQAEPRLGPDLGQGLRRRRRLRSS